ncbi:hypothetical protein ACGFNU_38280 [Spirillospora sp. NPDC048911]|uniref:hypothetical protein n=1 Tax=Spirillospora sp. NPDC048911 TaxID=3364527 RepID=UPI003721041C
MQLYNEPVAVTGHSPSGAPTALTWRGNQFHVRSVREIWQMPGEARLYRVNVAMEGGRQGIAEIAGGESGWRLRHLWL